MPAQSGACFVEARAVSRSQRRRGRKSGSSHKCVHDSAPSRSATPWKEAADATSVRARESAVKSSIAQSTAACAGPAFGGGPARRQPVPPQGAEALAFTGRRTMNTRGTRPGLSPTFYRWAEPSLTVQPLGTGRPLAISAVYRGPDFPRACSSSPDTDGVLQPRKSMTMLDLLAMEPAKAAPIPERNRKSYGRLEYLFEP